MWASLGLTRVMFCVVGPFAIIVHEKLLTLNTSFFISNSKIFKWGIGIAVISPILANSMFLERIGFPTGFGTEERIINQAIQELNIEGELKQNQTAYFAHPYFAVPLNRDPFNSNEVMRIEYYSNAKSGDLIIWDGHFAPNEHNTPLENLMNDSLLTQLGSLKPTQVYKPLNDIPFDIYVFRKK
jgi:hypothetical protein